MIGHFGEETVQRSRRPYQRSTMFAQLVLRGTNQSGLRDHNERLVLTLVRQHGPLAKAQIARITGLSAQTVSVIMRALEADGLLPAASPCAERWASPRCRSRWRRTAPTSSA
jgi:predicted ArsR family transcriptional regulator